MLLLCCFYVVYMLFLCCFYVVYMFFYAVSMLFVCCFYAVSMLFICCFDFVEIYNEKLVFQKFSRKQTNFFNYIDFIHKLNLVDLQTQGGYLHLYRVVLHVPSMLFRMPGDIGSAPTRLHKVRQIPLLLSCLATLVLQHALTPFSEIVLFGIAGLRPTHVDESLLTEHAHCQSKLYQSRMTATRQHTQQCQDVFSKRTREIN